VDKQMIRDKRCLSFAIFIFSVLLSSWAFAQCDDCDDKNPCTKDLCEASTCQHIPQNCDNVNSEAGVSLGSGANSTPTSAEIPVQKPQVPSASNEAVNIPVSCDDKNPCTTDSYGANSCVHDPVNCDDGSPCTADSCGANGCVHDSMNCDDGSPCTADSCGANGCVHDPVNCDDGSPCTTDSCGANGCVHDPVNCDDGSPCTTDSCGANGCVHDPVNCDDGNANTTDQCGSSGCINTPLIGESIKTDLAQSLSTIESEIKNESAEENTTINESQSITEEKLLPICDDGNPCTTDAYDGTNCVYAQLNCDDGNDSTLDSCMDGACINKPLDSVSILSENNSTNLSSSQAPLAVHPPSCDDHDLCTEDTFNGKECEHKPRNCDDGNPNTFDYCFEGVCYNTTTSCDDGNPCTIDSFNGSACVHIPMNCDDHNACTIDTCKDGKCVHTPKNCDDGNPCTSDKCDSKTGRCFSTWKCDDGNPCTVDYCDSVRGCLHSPVVCAPGKTCIDGVCRNLYYPYATPYYPYYQPYIAPAASTTPAAQSYTIPAGTAITLPWASTVTALNTLKVENAVAYPGASPLKFMRSLGYEGQAISVYQTGQSISERSEMIGLSWKDASFTLTLIQPNGSALPVQGDNRNVIHLIGSNYDYYFLRNAAQGNWGIEIRPINPGANGAGFSLINGLVKGASIINQP